MTLLSSTALTDWSVGPKVVVAWNPLRTLTKLVVAAMVAVPAVIEIWPVMLSAPPATVIVPAAVVTLTAVPVAMSLRLMVLVPSVTETLPLTMLAVVLSLIVTFFVKAYPAP